MYFTSNRLHRYFLSNMDWSGGEGSNIRLSRIETKSSSYEMYCLQNDCSSSGDSGDSGDSDDSDGSSGNKNGDGDTVTIIIIVVAVVIGLLIIGLAVFFWQRKKRKDTNGSLLGYQGYNQMG